MSWYYFTETNEKRCLDALKAYKKESPTEDILELCKKQGVNKRIVAQIDKLLKANNISRAEKLITAYRGTNRGKIALPILLFVLTIGFLSPYLRDAIVDVDPLLEKVRQNSAAQELFGDNITTTWGFGVVAFQSGPDGKKSHYNGPISGTKGRGNMSYSSNQTSGLNSSILTVTKDGVSIRIE